MAIALQLSGCFVVNDPAEHGPAPLPAGQFCEEFASVFCDAIECGSCAPAPTELEALREGCTEEYSSFCGVLYGPLISDGRTGYDPEEMAVQLAIGRSLVAQCDETFWEWASSFDGLFSGFQGTVDRGGACDPTFEETPGRFDRARFFSCGQDACLLIAEDRWRCGPRLSEGDPCQRGQCEAGLTCVGHSSEDATVLGVCGDTRMEAGQPCDEERDCLSGACQLAINDGRCLSVDETYCSVLGGCEASQFILGSDESGPLVEGGRCDFIALCLTAEQAADVADEIDCARVPSDAEEFDVVDAFCDRNGYSHRCTATPGVLERSELEPLCEQSRAIPPPLFYCGPSLL